MAWRHKARTLAIVSRIVSSVGIAYFLLIGLAPTQSMAEPIVIRCHQDYTFTPKVPDGFSNIKIISPILSTDPAVATGLGRPGGGTAGAIVISGHGQFGDATITYKMKDEFTGQTLDVVVGVLVDCPPPKDPKKHLTHIQTNCADCLQLSIAINAAIDAYNDAVDAERTNFTQLAAMLAKIQLQITKDLKDCEAACKEKKRYPRLHTVVTSCKRATCIAIADRLNTDIEAFNKAVDGGKTDSGQLDTMLANIRKEGDDLTNCEKACGSLEDSSVPGRRLVPHSDEQRLDTPDEPRDDDHKVTDPKTPDAPKKDEKTEKTEKPKTKATEKTFTGKGEKPSHGMVEKQNLKGTNRETGSKVDSKRSVDGKSPNQGKTGAKTGNGGFQIEFGTGSSGGFSGPGFGR
jgi:hypothetical protein